MVHQEEAVPFKLLLFMSVTAAATTKHRREGLNLTSSSENGGREHPRVFVRKSSKSESEVEDEEERKVSLKSTGSRKVSLEGVGT